jgi:hypothetical protein
LSSSHSRVFAFVLFVRFLCFPRSRSASRPNSWWQMRSAFSEQGVFLFNPYGAPLGQDQSFRFPCDGLMGRSSKYVHEIVPDKTTKIQQLVCL